MLIRFPTDAYPFFDRFCSIFKCNVILEIINGLISKRHSDNNYCKMKKVIILIKKIWNDPVWSNLIANAFTALAAYLFYKYISGKDKVNTVSVYSKAPVKSISHVHDNVFQTPFSQVMIYIVLGCLAVLMGVFLFRLIRGIRKET
jgi:hypothetical protein